jgi:hypothetical protein
LRSGSIASHSAVGHHKDKDLLLSVMLCGVLELAHSIAQSTNLAKESSKELSSILIRLEVREI